MMKNLRFILMSMLVMLGMTASAGSIVFGDLGLENGVKYSDPFDGGDFTVTFAGGGNDGKYYTTGSGIRVYGGGTMTIEAKSGTLTKIVITYDGTNKPTTPDVVDGGTYDPATGTWTGDAQKVVFTRPSGSGHWRVKKIEVGDDTQGPVTPTEGQTPETALTVARALEIIEDLANGGKTDFIYYVKGKVNEITYKGSTFSFTMGDGDAATALLTVYKAKGLQNKDIVDQSFMKVGDDVVVIGQLQKYVKEENVIPELSDGYVYSVNGKTESAEVSEPTIEGGTTPETALTVSAAVAAINTMVDGQTTKNSYYVKGYIVGNPDFQRNKDNELYGNVNFDMADEKGGSTKLTVFHAKSFENKNFTETTTALLKAGDLVVFQGKLQKYVKNNETTPELASGYLISVNGQTTFIEAVQADVVNAPVYNLAGQRVEKAQKGLYIQNGKKFFVK